MPTKADRGDALKSVIAEQEELIQVHDGDDTTLGLTGRRLIEITSDQSNDDRLRSIRYTGPNVLGVEITKEGTDDIAAVLVAGVTAILGVFAVVLSNSFGGSGLLALGILLIIAGAIVIAAVLLSSKDLGVVIITTEGPEKVELKKAPNEFAEAVVRQVGEVQGQVRRERPVTR